VPATTTHQRKRIARVGGHARLADSPELQATRQLLEVPSASGAAHRPREALVGIPLAQARLALKAVRAAGRVPKATKPDCSNLAKIFEDRLPALRFFEDDARVVALSVEQHPDR
ncbi:MAG: RusA family crossover junction endodeoxyribonuclease, partial [Vicinamibacteraceae bacterium]